MQIFFLLLFLISDVKMLLKNIDPLISPDLLHAMAQMGHGDLLVLGDANFPGHSVAADKEVDIKRTIHSKNIHPYMKFTH